MDEKPTFGVNAKPDQEPKTGAGVTPANNETSQAPQPTFGVSAKTDKQAGPVFGTASAAGSQTETKKSIFQWAGHIFKMQPASFWVKEYVFSVLGVVLTYMVYPAMPTWLLIVNLLMYPFTVTILQEIGRNKENNGTFSQLFFGFAVGTMGDSLFLILIYAAIRLIIFYIKFSFSFIIGTIGLIYMYSQVKKIEG